MRRRDAVDLFPVTFLVVRQCAQDGRKYHPRPVDPGHGLVELDRALGLGALDARRSDRIVCGDTIQISGDRPHYQMRRPVRVTRALTAGVDRQSKGSNEGNRSNQTHALVNPQDARPFVEQRLLFRVGLRLLGGEAKV